jgi:cell pole-organizing protein PopZ
MADTNAQEPTMEEILASIRRIISEDDAPAAEAKPAEAAPEPEAEVEAAAEDGFEAETEFEEAVADTVDDDVLELTEKAEPAPAAPVHSLGDLDVFSADEPEPAPPPPAPEPAPVIAAAPPPRPAPATTYMSDNLISDSIADRAASSFGKLARSVSMPAEGRDLEAIVRDMLRPMLKEWLDEHLPAIVEAQVQAEVERISRLR